MFLNMFLEKLLLEYTIILPFCCESDKKRERKKKKHLPRTDVIKKKKRYFHLIA